ncbi:MAG: PQQ-binding-like beta-propeller repeat protein, partial [Candidatus Neomarinimicrobiota bacterium]
MILLIRYFKYFHIFAVIYILSGCYQGQFISSNLNFENGSESPDLSQRPDVIWSEKQSSSIAAMEVIDQNNVLVTTYKGEVYILHSRTGKKASKKLKPFRSRINDYILNRLEQMLYLGSRGDEEILAYDLRQNRIRWKYKITQLFGLLAEDSGKIFAVQRDGVLIALNKITGEEYDRMTINRTLSKGFIRNGDQLLLMFTDGSVLSFSNDFKKHWENQVNISLDPMVILKDSMIYIHDEVGKITVISPEGIINRVISLEPVPVYSEPVFNDSTMFVGYANGSVFSYSRRMDQELWH